MIYNITPQDDWGKYIPKLLPGDILNFLPGEHSNKDNIIIGCDGTDKKQIVLRGHNGTIFRDGQTIFITGDHIRIQDIKFTGWKRSVFKVGYNNHVEFIRCHFEKNKDISVMFISGADHKILDCEFVGFVSLWSKFLRLLSLLLKSLKRMFGYGKWLDKV